MRILNKILGIVVLLVVANSVVFAQDAPNHAKEQKSIVVITDRVEKANIQYAIYPEVSEMVAAEIINTLNNEGVIKAPTLSSTREKLRTPELISSSTKLLNNYRYTYGIDYSALKKIAKTFNTSNVLLVTGAMDTTSDFLKPTWWSFLNVPGENVVKTEYRLYTYIALVDTNTETIKWQNTYHRQITSPEFALANATNSPDYRQLTKLKKSSAAIAKDATYRIEGVLTPWFIVDKEPPTIHELVKYQVNKKYDECVQNINDWKTKRAEDIAAKKEAQKSQQRAAQIEQEKQLQENTKKANEVSAVLKSDSSNKKIKAENNLLIKNHQKQKDKTLESNMPETQAPELRGTPSDFNDILISPLNIIIPKM